MPSGFLHYKTASCKAFLKSLGNAAASGLAVADSSHLPASLILQSSAGSSTDREAEAPRLSPCTCTQCRLVSTVRPAVESALHGVICLASHLDTPPAHDAQESRTANDKLQRPSRMQRSTSPRCCCGRRVPPLPWGAPQQSARARPSVRRAAATPARASVDDARSETEGSSWPRRAQPDDAKNGGPGRSYDDAGVTASVDDAQLAKNRETFLLRLASLGFGVRSEGIVSHLLCTMCAAVI